MAIIVLLFRINPSYAHASSKDHPECVVSRAIMPYAIAIRRCLKQEHCYRHAHDAYTAFMEKHGFTVTKNHHLETAWVVTYTHGQGGRVLGVNSEMDALPGIGHAQLWTHSYWNIRSSGSPCS